MATIDTRVLVELMLERFAETLASLATSHGRRESLAQVEDLAFLHLVEALRRQGHSAKVVADLFGFASLTSLRRKLRKIREGRLASAQSLRQFILARVTDSRVSRRELMADLDTRDAAIVRGLIHDLDRQGVLRETEDQMLELAHGTGEQALSDDALEVLVHVLVGDRAMDLDELEECLGVPRERIASVAERLVGRGVVERDGDRLRTGVDWNLFPAIETDDAVTSLFHHFRGACRAIVGTVRKWDEAAPVGALEPPAVITATFEVADGDPMRDALLSAHRRFAAEIADLYARHGERGSAETPSSRITIYTGTAVDPIEPAVS